MNRHDYKIRLQALIKKQFEELSFYFVGPSGDAACDAFDNELTRMAESHESEIELLKAEYEADKGEAK